jgi:Uma2 family endonuclease
MGSVTMLPTGRAFSRRDLDSMPDDGRRYELVDGTLVVTPAPSPRHQRAVARLHLILAKGCPPDLDVLFAPLDVVLTDDTVLQPDLLVARRSDFTDRDLPVVPLLAVEVLSASTRRVDLTLKRSRFQAAGCPSYWVVDPDEPSVTAWDLHGGQYVEVAHAAGGQEFVSESPYPVSFCPAQLTD